MTDQKIKLGDQEYVIPKLAIKQNKVVEPLITKHLDFFKNIKQHLTTGTILNLTKEQNEDFTQIVYVSITRAKPNFTMEEFENLPCGIKDIMLALPTCVMQSGLFVASTEGGGNQKSGEAPSPSTGTGSPQA